MRREPALRFHPRFTHLVDWGESVALLTDTGVAAVEDPVAVAVLRRVDGRRSASELVAEAATTDAAHAHFVLLHLERREVLVADGAVPEATGPPADVDPHLRQAAAVLHRAWAAREGAYVVVAPAALSGLGLGLEGAAVVLADDPLLTALVDHDRASVAGGGPYLPVLLGREAVWVGPRVGRGGSPCWACVRPRLEANLPARRVLHGEAPGGRRPRSVRPLPAAFPASRFVGVARAIATHAHRGVPAMLEHDVEGRLRVRHPVQPRPQCPGCGDPDLRVPASTVAPVSSTPLRALGTGLRVEPPATTLARLRPFVSPLTGAVRRVDPVPTPLDGVLHVYAASHGSRLADVLPASLKGQARDGSGGKGTTPEEAETSALAEAIERESAVLRGDEPTRIASLADLGADAVGPGALLLFSDRQYAGREAWNRAADPFHRVPEPCPPGRPIRWTPARSLVTGDERWLPLAFVYLGVEGEDARYARGDSNGLAAGSCVEEAILQGFLELVERDAVALWWYNRTVQPEVSVEGSSDGFVARAREAFAACGRSLWALDLTTDLGIPCVAAVSATGPAGGDVILGFGAHLDRMLALRRAVAELGQLLPSVLPPLEERKARMLPAFSEAVRWWERETVDGHPYLVPSGNAPAAAAAAGPVPHDLRDVLALCVARVRAVGGDLVVHDLSRPDLPLRVVRVVVPGLRHFWRRLGPGRLYDVPVGLGRLPRPRSEDELNPVSIFV